LEFEDNGSKNSWKICQGGNPFSSQQWSIMWGIFQHLL